MPNYPFDGANYQALLPLWTNAPVQVTITGTTARSTQLPLGWYLIRSTTNVHIKQGNVTSDADTNDFILGAGTVYPMQVTNITDNGYLSGIRVSANGTLQIQSTAG